MPQRMFWVTDLILNDMKMKGYFLLRTCKLQGFLNHQTKQEQRKKTKKSKEVLLQNLKAPVQKLGCFKMCTVWQQILNTSIVFSSHRWPQNLAEQVSSRGSKLSCWSKLCLSPNWPLLNIKLADWVNNMKLRWTLHINWTTLSSINCSISDNGS